MTNPRKRRTSRTTQAARKALWIQVGCVALIAAVLPFAAAMGVLMAGAGF